MDFELYRGDCLEVMKSFPVKSVDMVLCDLPYGTTACKWDSVIPFEPLWEQYKRLIKPNGAIVLFGAEPFSSHLRLSNLDWLRESLVWVKHKPSNFANCKHRHLKYSEDIVVFSGGKFTYHPQMIVRKSERVGQMQKGTSKKHTTVRTDGEEVSMQTQYAPKEWSDYDASKKYPSNILEFSAVLGNSKEKTPHPTQKPVALCEYLIKTYTNEGQIVMDNTMGSGTTGVACANTGRKFIGIEKEDNYFTIAEKRIKEAYDLRTILQSNLREDQHK